MSDLTPEQVMQNPQALGSEVIRDYSRRAREHEDDPQLRDALLEVADEIEPFVVYEYTHDLLRPDWAYEHWQPVVRLDPIPGRPLEEWPVADDDPDVLGVTLHLTSEGPSVEL